MPDDDTRRAQQGEVRGQVVLSRLRTGRVCTALREAQAMTRRTIWLPDGQPDVDPDKTTACMTHTRLVPCKTCEAADHSLDVIWSQRPSDVQHVRNEEAWRRVR